MPHLFSINRKVHNKSSCESSNHCKQQQTPAITISKKDDDGSTFALAAHHALGVLF